MFHVILPLALGSAVSPTLFTAIILILSQKNHPLLRATLYILGATIPLILMSVFLYFFSSSLKDIGFILKHYSSGVDIVISIILALAAATMYMAQKKKKIVLQPTTTVPQKNVSVLIHAFLLGVMMMATNFSTFALFIPAEKDIFFSTQNLGSQLTSVILLILITLLCLEIPLIFTLLAPRKASEILTPLGKWSAKHGMTIAIYLCAAFSIFLLCKGFFNLHF